MTQEELKEWTRLSREMDSPTLSEERELEIVERLHELESGMDDEELTNLLNNTDSSLR